MKISKNKDSWLVTGGAGFIGSHLIENLIKNNQRVICVDNFMTGFRSNLNTSPFLEVIDGNIQDLNLDNFNQCKGIFHLAAQVSVSKSIEYMFKSSSNNLTSTLKVWEIANELRIPIVYASSSAVYGDLPLGDDEIGNHSILSPYAMDKLTMERYASLSWDLHKTASLGLRFFNVYGPRQNPSSSYSGVISIFLDRLISGNKVLLNGGYQTRDFIYVKDVSRSLIDSMNYLLENNMCDICNLGTGKSVTINKLLEIVSERLDVRPKVVNKDLQKGDLEISNCSTNKLNSLLGIDNKLFTSLENGLCSTIKYIQRNKF